jgi:hypothetical protein
MSVFVKVCWQSVCSAIQPLTVQKDVIPCSLNIPQLIIMMVALCD